MTIRMTFVIKDPRINYRFSAYGVKIFSANPGIDLFKMLPPPDSLADMFPQDTIEKPSKLYYAKIEHSSPYNSSQVNNGPKVYSFQTKCDTAESESCSVRVMYAEGSDYYTIPLTEKQFLKAKRKFFPIAVVMFCIYAFMLLVLLQFVNSAIRNKLFSEKNIRRLHNTGIVFICLWGLAFLIKNPVRDYLVSSFSYRTNLDYTDKFNFTIFPESLILGFFFLVLSSAFKQGLNLQKEQELTI